jgi:D-glycero-D-manno-heptose 1,7-bisphosphate phosphatase
VSRPCVFLDRDGVINEKPLPGEYVASLRDFRIIPAAIDWIRLFNALDLLVVIVTNQRGIALGVMSEEDLDRIHAHMLELLAAAGARVDAVFHCPHQENSCECRKPRPGLILRAKAELDIDLARSIMIGDSDNDEELARRCGLKFVRVEDGRITNVITPAVPSLF